MDSADNQWSAKNRFRANAPVYLGYTDSKATVYLGYTYCQVPSPHLKKWQ
jgi:hypothetical protein